MVSQTPDLTQQVADLMRRVNSLEEQLAKLRAAEEIDEDVMIAISAAVAAYTGYRGRVKAVRYRAGRGYGQAIRERQHNRYVALSR